MNGESYIDLETRGFVVVRGFLPPDELQLLRDDFERASLDANRNYNLRSASAEAIALVTPRVQQVLTLVNQQTILKVDAPAGTGYFATGVVTGIDLPWHQDHESYFILQNHFDYLNFYMPIVKPDIEKSNLSIVPFDVLQREAPKAYKILVRSGATHFHAVRGRCLAVSDETGAVRVIRQGMESLAYTPKLAAGDLLLLRGDMVHHTQDADTERVALSFRAANQSSLVTRSRLAAGGVAKALMMANNAQQYQMMFKAFDVAQRDDLPIKDLLVLLDTLEPVDPARRREFMKQLLKEKRRSRALTSFALSAPTALGLRGLASAQARYHRYRHRLDRRSRSLDTVA